MKSAVFIIAALLTIGCVSQQEPLMFIKIPGHPETYQFSYDVRETVKIDSIAPETIRSALLNEDAVTFLINATEDSTVSGHYSVVATNIIQKLKTYQLYSGRIVNDYPVYIYDDARRVWLNATGETTPDIRGAIIWLDALANGTSVAIDDGMIYVKGDSYENMARAGDKLALIFMNVSEATLKNA